MLEVHVQRLPLAFVGASMTAFAVGRGADPLLSTLASVCLACVAVAYLSCDARAIPWRMYKPLQQLLIMRPPVACCTSEDGLVGSLPPELLLHILASGGFTAETLARCAAVCSAFNHIIKDPSSDHQLWQPVCCVRWASRAYDPLRVYPKLSLLSHRERYIWAECDGARQLGTGEDLSKVCAWSVKFSGRPAYVIGPFPYRLNGTYVSPTFDGEPRRYSVTSKTLASLVMGSYSSNTVLVDGIPDVRMVRRKDWGWELRNAFWVARSVNHGVQPCEDYEMREFAASWPSDAGVVLPIP